MTENRRKREKYHLFKNPWLNQPCGERNKPEIIIKDNISIENQVEKLPKLFIEEEPEILTDREYAHHSVKSADYIIQQDQRANKTFYVSDPNYITILSNNKLYKFKKSNEYK